MAEKVSLASQVAAVENAKRWSSLTPGQKRLAGQHLEAAANTLRYLQVHQAELREFMQSKRADA